MWAAVPDAISQQWACLIGLVQFLQVLDFIQLKFKYGDFIFEFLPCDWTLSSHISPKCIVQVSETIHSIGFDTALVFSHKILLHYIPMIGVCVLAVGYSVGIILFYPCEEQFDYGNQLCGGACYQSQIGVGIFDPVFTVLLPVTLIIFFNSLLIFRVIYQKHSMLQRNILKKNIRMLAQLLTVSLLHVAVWMPLTTVLLIATTSVPAPQIINDLVASNILINLVYLSVLGNPVVSIFAIPEIKTKINDLINRWLPKPFARRVEPGTEMMRRTLPAQ